ncbi:MAG: TIGR00366 family protein [Pseudomonadota bacterium]
MLERGARAFARLLTGYFPDPFVFAVLMTAVAFALALVLTDATAGATLIAWGDGLPGLMGFTAQIAITLLAAHALAHTDRLQALLARIGTLPRSAVAAYALVVVTTAASSLIAWSLGLVAGATIARAVAVHCARRDIVVHYPLLVASAYAGFVVWHMGYSGSAPLFVATPGHSLEAQIGLLPVTETIGTAFNGTVIILTVSALCVLCPLLRPRDADTLPFEPPATAASEAQNENTTSPAARLANRRPLSILLGGLLWAYLGLRWGQQGFVLTLDLVNWTLVGAGLLFARSLAHYARLILDAGATVGAIIIQYPFYAGMLGIMTGTGLVQVLADAFVSVANADTLGLFAFLSAGLINLFIPSGGGQWAVQGPVFIEAARQLNVDPAAMVLAIAYGDQWTNLIQPFWTIPMLAIAGLPVQKIIPYCFAALAVTGVIFAGALLWLGAG